MQRFQVHPLSVLIGVVLGVACLIAMGANAQVQALEVSYGPPKKHIVNIFEPQPANASIPPLGTLVVYEVPSDLWLTVTGVAASTSFVSGADLPRWVEVLDGGLTPKGLAASGAGGAPQSTGGPIGWTFRPGSKVAIHNPDGVNGASAGTWSLVGYLSRN